MSDDHDDVTGRWEVRYRLLCPTRHGGWKEGRGNGEAGSMGRAGQRALASTGKCTLPIVFSTWGQASNVHILEYLERDPVRYVRLAIPKTV